MQNNTENQLAAICQKVVLSFPEAVIYTGFSESLLRKLCMKRMIPHSKPTGGRVLFSKSLLDKFLLSNPIATADELKSAAVNFTVSHPPKTGGLM